MVVIEIVIRKNNVYLEVISNLCYKSAHVNTLGKLFNPGKFDDKDFLTAESAKFSQRG